MYNSEKEKIINYYKNEILTKIDPSLYKVKYNCFACYYRNFLLKQNSTECLFSPHFNILFDLIHGRLLALCLLNSDSYLNSLLHFKHLYIISLFNNTLN